MKRGVYMSKNKKSASAEKRTFDYGTHPGAYTSHYDINNTLLDTVDATDDFIDGLFDQRARANSASPAAADPPVPNRAHTEI